MQKPLSLLVTDTNIWIDLDNGGILFEVFQLPYKLITSDFAITELMRPGWQSLKELGLEFVELEPNLVSEWLCCIKEKVWENKAWEKRQKCKRLP